MLFVRLIKCLYWSCRLVLKHSHALQNFKNNTWCSIMRSFTCYIIRQEQHRDVIKIAFVKFLSTNNDPEPKTVQKKVTANTWHKICLYSGYCQYPVSPHCNAIAKKKPLPAWDLDGEQFPVLGSSTGPPPGQNALPVRTCLPEDGSFALKDYCFDAAKLLSFDPPVFLSSSN